MQSLGIGDTIPNLLWNMPLQIIDHQHENEAITLNDYRDKKVIVLDFWNTWCGSCITGIKHSGELSSELKSHIAIIPITEQRRDEIEKFKSQNSTIKNTTLNLVTDGKNIARYFPHELVPHVVFIKNSKVVHIGGYESLSEQNIQMILANEEDKLLYVKNDKAIQKSLLESIDTNSRLMYTIVGSYRKDILPSEIKMIDTLKSYSQLSLFNFSIKELLEYAFKLPSISTNRFNLMKTRLTIGDISYHKSMGDKIVWLSKNALCFEERVPSKISDLEFRSTVLTELSRYLNVDISFGPSKVKVYEIIRNSKSNNPPKEGKYIQLYYLIDAYNRLPNHIPILDNEQISKKVYVPKRTLSDLNSEELIGLIKESGCQLIATEARINTIKITDR
jgi:thiol-disulfide isomerase/thioredoxin